MGRLLKGVLKVLGILWASPYTLLGLTIGGVGLCTGGRARVREGIVEFYGGGTGWFVRHLPLGETTMGFTLGHTVLGQTDAGLDIVRKHELVHVRQFERWGPLMGPAYLGCSVALWLMGRRAYWDNPFERQAFRETEEE
jgi:hypothetical protein